MKSLSLHPNRFLIKIYNSQASLMERIFKATNSIDQITESSLIPTPLISFINEQNTIVQSIRKGAHVEKLPKSLFDEKIPKFLKQLSTGTLQISPYESSGTSNIKETFQEVQSGFRNADLELLGFVFNEMDFVQAFIDAFYMKKAIKRAKSHVIQTFDCLLALLIDQSYSVYTKNFIVLILALQESLIMIRKQAGRLFLSSKKEKQKDSGKVDSRRSRMSVRRSLMMNLHRRSPVSKTPKPFEMGMELPKEAIKQKTKAMASKFKYIEESQFDFEEIKKKIKEISSKKAGIKKEKESPLSFNPSEKQEERGPGREEKKEREGEGPNEKKEGGAFRKMVVIKRSVSPKQRQMTTENDMEEMGSSARGEPVVFMNEKGLKTDERVKPKKLSTDELEDKGRPGSKGTNQKKNQVIEFNNYLSKISKSNSSIWDELNGFEGIKGNSQQGERGDG